MRLLVALALVVATLPIALPAAAACHPDLHYETPTYPSVTLTYSSSCDHKWQAVCVGVEGLRILDLGQCVGNGSLLP